MFEAHFQTFEEPQSGVALAARLAAFREELAQRKLTGFVIPRADQQQNEYVAASEERLAWLTGFTGSAGMAIVLTREAAVFVDGRYTLQAAKQVDRKAWHIEPLADPPPEHWLARHLTAGDRLGFDPWLHTSAAAERLASACAKAGAELIAVDRTRWIRCGPRVRAPRSAPFPFMADIFRRDRSEKLKRIRLRSASSASCAGAVGQPAVPGLQHSAAPTSRTRRCLCLRAGAEGRPPHRLHRHRKLSNLTRDHLDNPPSPSRTRGA